MDFLKSAVASAIAKGSGLPFTLGDRVDVDQTIFTLHNATRREDGSKCSVFSFDLSTGKSRAPLARNALRKFRTLRHPGVLKVIDTVETESQIYIITERLIPLSWHIKRKSLSPEILKWGLYNTAKTIKFINDEGSSIHGNIRASSIFTSEGGEWKLGGFEVLSSVKEDDAVIYNYATLMPDYLKHMPPEVANSGWEIIRRQPIHAVDAYSFGNLTSDVFSHSSESIGKGSQNSNIPPSMLQSHKRLISTNPKLRISVGHFIDQGRRSGGFFETHLISVIEGIDNLGVKSETEREQFLEELQELSGDDVPEELLKMKILPELLKSVEFGGGGPRVFSLVVKMSKNLSDEEFESKITPVIVRLFGNPDRAIRVCLLDSLTMVIDRLPQKIVNDKIFPQMTTGFTDLAPLIREQSVKAVLVIINKLSDRTINGELLRQLAKTANDPEPGIRANTTICLGKISKNLGSGTRSKVLIAAFTRSLRDPFVHARNSSLLAIAATADVFSESDCANKLLPAITPSLLDPEKIVRDSAFKTLDLLLSRVKKLALTLPDTTTAPTAVPLPSKEQGSSWAGWAVSSFTNKMTTATGDIQTRSLTPKAVPSTGLLDGRPTSAPPTGANNKTSSAPKTGLSVNASRRVTPFPSGLTLETPPEPAEEFDNDVMDDWNDAADDSLFENEIPIPEPISQTGPGPGSPAIKNQMKQVESFDDGGEPDFAGWLAEQQKAKKGNKSTILNKTKNRGELSTSAHAAEKKHATVSNGPGAAKKPVKAPKPTAVEEDWSAWD